jgi:hypothetical protein
LDLVSESETEELQTQDEIAHFSGHHSQVRPVAFIAGTIAVAAIVLVVLAIITYIRSVRPEESAAATLTSIFALISLLCLAYVIAVILMLAWVAKDSRNRGMDGGAVWVIAILLFGFVGLIVYLASRPHGILMTCNRCHNRKLNYVLLCPHCGSRT